jgi:kynurenine formamidase
MARVIDLSHEITEGMVTYPGLPGPVISDFLSREASRDRYEPGTEFQIGRIDMIANTGTYLDTPAHRYEGGWDLSGLDLDRVADVPGVVIDASAALEAGAKLIDGIEVAGMAVLFYTGWDRHWGTDEYGSHEHPYLGNDLVDRLSGADPALVGIDSVNIDATTTGARPVHSGLLAAGIPIVEHLRGLDRLLGESFRFTAAPPAVAGLGTFTVRAFAVVDR